MFAKIMFLVSLLLIQAQASANEFYTLCCSIGPKTTLNIATSAHSDRGLQYNVSIAGLTSHTGPAGENGVNLPGSGVCGWIDRPVFSDNRRFQVWASWLANLTDIQYLTSVIPGRGIETQMVFANQFRTGNFASHGSKFCIPARGMSGSSNILEVKPSASWWMNPPDPWGGRKNQ